MGPPAGSLGFPREFNSESEQVAADRRARVAAAVNQQEWLDREEIKWIPKKYRHNIRHEKPGVHNVSDEDEYSYPEEAQTPRDEEQGKMASYLMGPEPVDEPKSAVSETAKRYSYHLAVIIFGLILLGSCYFFWDSMHTHIDPHRPTLAGVQYEQVAGDAAPAVAAAADLAPEVSSLADSTDGSSGMAGAYTGLLPQADAATIA